METGRWYALHTFSRHEKQVALHLTHKRIEHFLPAYETVHRWKNGARKLQLPLFPGYLFTRISLNERLRVIEIPGVASIVGSSRGPEPVSEEEIERVHRVLNAPGVKEPLPYLGIGDRVLIVRGPLAGIEGILMRIDNRCKVVISVELIMSSMTIEVAEHEIAPVTDWAAPCVRIAVPQHSAAQAVAGR
ncbi:MAG: UpxY family transcription antiterminator [Acidobacteria bacterium]|nr:UpxY family transcription antiterminator [Acidobacteriota bacterium]